MFAASRAVTVIALLPEIRPTLQDQLVVPVAVTVAPVVVFTHVTCVTPTLSEAVPVRAIGVAVVVHVGPDVGDVIATVGGVESARLNVAATLALPVIVKVVGFAPEFENDPPLPDQPANVQPGCGVAVRLMFVPAVKPPLQFCPVFTETMPDPPGLTPVESE